MPQGYEIDRSLDRGLDRGLDRSLRTWWTRKMPQVSLPCLPASLRKHVDTPVMYGLVVRYGLVKGQVWARKGKHVDTPVEDGLGVRYGPDSGKKGLR